MTTNMFEILDRLVGFPTESRSSNVDLIAYYADRAAELGGRVHLVAGETDADPRSNLYVAFGPETEGGVFLSGHTDVVPAGTGWASDPYQVTRVDDRLYGRGTADMKGFLAAALEAMSKIDVKRLQHPVYLGLSYDEEIGCVGVRHLLDHLRGVESCRPEVIIVGEPTQMQLCTAHSGKRVFRAEIKAPSGHSSRSPEQATAIEAGAAIITALGEVNASSHQNGRAYSTNVGTINGGVAVNVLSPNCELDFECRHQATHSPDDLLRPVFETIGLWADRLRCIDGDIAVVETVAYPALATSTDEPAFRRLAAALPSASQGEVSFGCEAGLYVEALPGAAVIFGPGNIADAHRPDEYVLAPDLAMAADNLISVIDRFSMLTDNQGA